ncbi:probable Mediator of RNA polymerase II transcription subunit 10 [Saccharomycodes ludwigii]|uniref:Mediator of RNA polymerase II transcription subunit 10 n=1 Tax=Saccharomycodes ludwigii TaxID=36035 RepID=A0A376BBR9_9ASCO|nr:hypothetical protein SCDLUD_000036 [Saccharomycodes ludwigii]KAH3902459.1 hypothetical protein SCDLUD_000036 [Saccharomycodes ludwigii]SSD61580.1 probable Mediator of RNA polymerase II transcription subunit 10 [Saccharomycodes ludwigii]
MDPLQNSLDTTQDLLSEIIEGFIELGVSVYDFPGTDEAKQGMVTNLKRNFERIVKLDQLANTDKNLNNVNVPLDVLQYIEDGRNPDVYTREFVEAIKRSNQYQRGKMLAMRQLRDSLATKIIEEFPDLEKQVDLITKKTTNPTNENNLKL